MNSYEKRKVTEISDLLSVIERLVNFEKLDDGSYEALRSSHPLVDDGFSSNSRDE